MTVSKVNKNHTAPFFKALGLHYVPQLSELNTINPIDFLDLESHSKKEQTGFVLQTPNGVEIQLNQEDINSEPLMAALNTLINNMKIGNARLLRKLLLESLDQLRETYVIDENQPFMLKHPQWELHLTLHQLNEEEIHAIFLRYPQRDEYAPHHLERMIQDLAYPEHSYLGNLLESPSAPEDFLHAILGFDPYDEIPWLDTLVAQIKLQSIEEDSHQMQLLEPAFWGLSAEAEALIKAADELEQSLELAPRPNSPDILELIRMFLEIIRTVNQMLNRLLCAELALLEEEKRIITRYVEQLHERAQYHETFLQYAHARGRVQVLLASVIEEQMAKTDLALSLNQLTPFFLDEADQQQLMVELDDLKLTLTSLLEQKYKIKI